MTPNSSNSKKQKRTDPNRNSPASDRTRLTRRELLGTLCLGLAIAGLSAGIVFLTGKKPASAPEKPDRPRQLAAFSLTDRTGRTVTQDDVAGKILVVNFVFTSCSLSCRAVNDRMAEIQRLVGDASDVQLVSLTVDPRTDTPSVLAKFADGF
ncbi:MAG TPA: SCO family protein, partial [Candidatus Paceibacterota bacterium]|nr:SCO family protein [Candidatus Paceibacterota bacterium]